VTLLSEDISRPSVRATRAPALVSVEMGYGHLRAALPLADAFSAPMLHADEAPLADEDEHRLWETVRRIQELLSKPSRFLVGEPRKLMDRVTSIPPLYARRDLSRPNLGVHVLDWLVTRGLGRGLVDTLRRTGSPLLTTFYAPAIIADRAGHDRIYCVATDADLNRVWAPKKGAHSRIHYFAPSTRVVRRLETYGVRPEQITLTGFPLPLELTGGGDLAVLREQLARRLVRLDPKGVFQELHGDDVTRALGPLPEDERGAPPRLMFAVGGAGAQAELAFDFLPSLRDALVAGNLELWLVAGVRPEVAHTFERAVEKAGLEACLDRSVHLLYETRFDAYYRAMNHALAETDILWTKPSELSFYGALGLPIVISKPVGAHERFNRRWLREHGVGLKQQSAAHADSWLTEWLEDGVLAGAAWAGFSRLPKTGTHKIAAHLRGVMGDR
jgi:hypothetical protein